VRDRRWQIVCDSPGNAADRRTAYQAFAKQRREKGLTTTVLIVIAAIVAIHTRMTDPSLTPSSRW
jgi:hypothetical protein